VTNAAELNIPVLVQKYASRFGPIARRKSTSDIIACLSFQKKFGRRPSTFQVQGWEVEKLDYDVVIEHFNSPPLSRKEIVNLLDGIRRIRYGVRLFFHNNTSRHYSSVSK